MMKRITLRLPEQQIELLEQMVDAGEFDKRDVLFFIVGDDGIAEIGVAEIIAEGIEAEGNAVIDIAFECQGVRRHLLA